MSNEVGTVNSQIVDSTADVVTLLTGQAPAQSFGLLDAVMAETMGMAMHNAVSRQQGASVVSSAAITTACAKMLAVPFPIMPPPSPPPPPPVVVPLPGPTPDPSPKAAAAAAFAEAETAVDVLKKQAADANSLSQAAQADLGKIITDAGGTPPPSPPPPPAPPSPTPQTPLRMFAAAHLPPMSFVSESKSAAPAADQLNARISGTSDFSPTVGDAPHAFDPVGGSGAPARPIPIPRPVPAPDPSAEAAAAAAAAFAQAKSAIDVLKSQASSSTTVAQTARVDLSMLITEAGGTPPAQPLAAAVSDPSLDAAVAAAFAQAESAIGFLRAHAHDNPNVAQTVHTDLNKLITEAGGTTPTSQT